MRSTSGGVVNPYLKGSTMEIVNEEWRPVVGFEGKFEVSNHGRVKALPWELRHWCGKMIPQPEKLVALVKHSGGYRIVSLRQGTKKAYVHRLVMEAFVGPPGERQDVNHIDGNKANNRLDNLEYCDRLHNVRHAIATGLQDNAGEGNGMHRYTTEQVIAAHRRVEQGASQKQAAAETGVSVGMVSQIVKGKRWRHLGLPVLGGVT